MATETELVYVYATDDSSYRVDGGRNNYNKISGLALGHVSLLKHKGVSQVQEGITYDVATDIYQMENLKETNVIVGKSNTTWIGINPNDLTMNGTHYFEFNDPRMNQYVRPGRPCLIEMGLDCHSSTAFDHTYGVLDFDLGEIMSSMVLAGAVRYTRSAYAVKATAVAIGFLKPYVANKYGCRVSWKFKHNQKPLDDFDGISFSLDLSWYTTSLYEVLHRLSPFNDDVNVRLLGDSSFEMLG